MSALLQCLSHTPLVGLVDPAPVVLAEVEAVIATARARIERFDPELVILFSPDHYNGFFYDVMRLPDLLEQRANPRDVGAVDRIEID